MPFYINSFNLHLNQFDFVCHKIHERYLLVYAMVAWSGWSDSRIGWVVRLVGSLRLVRLIRFLDWLGSRGEVGRVGEVRKDVQVG